MSSREVDSGSVRGNRLSGISGDSSGDNLGISLDFSGGGNSLHLGRSGSLNGGGGGLIRTTLTLQIRDSIGTGSDSDKVSTTVLVVSEPDLTVIPVVHDVSSAEESVTKNGELVILEDTQNTALLVVPDEVGVGNLDSLAGEGEVNGTLDVSDRTVDVNVGAAVPLSGREVVDDLVEDGAGQSAHSVTTVKKNRLATSREDGVGRAIFLLEADGVQVDPVSGIVSYARFQATGIITG